MEAVAPDIDNMDRDDLYKMLKTLQSLLEKTHDRITSLKEKEQIKNSTPPIDTLKQKEPTKNSTPLVDPTMFQIHEPGLIDKKLLEAVHKKLKKLKFKAHPKNKDSPQLFLFGSRKYPFSPLSANLQPTWIDPDSVWGKFLNAVNQKLGTSYNSMLVNKYKDLNCFLEFHKDDERCLDRTSPISAMSLGATRKFNISLDNNKFYTVETLVLESGSLLTMMPGFQQLYWHSIEAGDKDCEAERGVRYSVTLRCLLPPTPTPTPTLVSAPAMSTDTVTDEDVISTSVSAPVAAPSNVTPSNASQQTLNTPDTLVFGSSLVKGLDEKILSKYDKNFKVFANSGACIGDIYEVIEKVRDSGKYELANVTNVFLICGGNDVENMKSDKDITFVYDDIEDIVYRAKLVFPNAKINLVSLIPRRAEYNTHIRNMHKVNFWLKKFCANESVRYVDVFSFFLLKSASIWTLNKKLFNGSKLQLLQQSSIGDSVLAKVLKY